MNRFEKCGEIITVIRAEIHQLEQQKAAIQTQIDFLNQQIEKNVYLLHGYNKTSEHGK
jgi:predicted  nucleic acid-binding Zn-ribbon protein